MKRDSLSLFSQIQTQPNKKRRLATNSVGQSTSYLNRVAEFAKSVDKMKADFDKLREPSQTKPIPANRFKFGIVLKEGPDKGRPIRAEFNSDGTWVKDSTRFVKESPLITPIPRSTKQKPQPFILNMQKPLIFSKIATQSNTVASPVWISMSKKSTISCK